MFFFLSCIMFYVYSKIYVITNVIIQCLIYVCILFLSRNKYLNVKKVERMYSYFTIQTSPLAVRYIYMYIKVLCF